MMLVLMVPIQNAVRQFEIAIDGELNVTKSSSGVVVSRDNLHGHVQMATNRYSDKPCLFVHTKSPMIPLQFIMRFEGVRYNADNQPQHLGAPYLKEICEFWANLKKHGWAMPGKVSPQSSQETWSPSSGRKPSAEAGTQGSSDTNSTGTWSPPPNAAVGASARVVGQPPKITAIEGAKAKDDASAAGAPSFGAAAE